MASFNRVMLMGNLTRDIELRYLPSGMAVSEFGLAVNDKRKNSDGQWVEDVNFFDITLYGRTAEVASEYLSKGSPIFIEGRLKHDTWEKDGQKRSKVKVIGERMQMIGGRSDSGGGQGGSVREPSSSPQRYVNSNTDSGSPPPSQAPSQASQPSRDAQPTGNGPGYDEPEIPF
ncbi:single-stranded DNA-binding protein [Allorhodopirellula solitaria]|uniref:Single-stranded DNA-binding protein n=1 Tax=Allorhodopirellula solitaria TaxID=2527987 RepID=A0A5C5XUA4_9BACT|nr:single-stranded DNA-binding protein [Allorhodopirellula solitaria]TWT65182.1 Single-stranded DNA-binding protein [Allorhodopirellula solitaria]